MAHDVFICHSSLDKAAADAVCAALEARGIRCWIAPRDIRPGQDWAAAIVDAIRGAQILVLVFSGHANESPQVRREVERAANLGKGLLPLRIEDVKPQQSLEYYLNEPHWLDAITKPFAAHLDKLADACEGMLAVTGRSPQTMPGISPRSAGTDRAGRWWRRRRKPVTLALIAAVAILLAVAGITVHLLRPDPTHRSPSSPGAAATGPSFGSPTPVSPAESNAARAQVVQLTGSWSDQGFVDAIVGRDTNIVALYLKSGLKATTLEQGTSAIVYGFQGVSQDGDAVDLVKTFQANGFKVDDQLQDSFLLGKLTNDFLPLMFGSEQAPRGYTGGYQDGKFVGSLLFWIVQRGVWMGPTDQDIQVINYLISQGADCKVPLSFLNYNGRERTNKVTGTNPYDQLIPMMQDCAK
ncbi:toll/interleukin-1 receptor domain-containing protein [Mycobacterium sp. OAS707]|uniref:toll/interleukin-1 receptor domain-containing protein n=1 Tax=Mycobacterium sp. OAS707 TaxID=2663822 RepID=UPI001CEF0475|nr:toll/interleukin-1 receptor domain-containing protein [Mycobacterium sp. OAS707]